MHKCDEKRPANDTRRDSVLVQADAEQSHAGGVEAKAEERDVDEKLG